MPQLEPFELAMFSLALICAMCLAFYLGMLVRRAWDSARKGGGK